MLNTLFVERRTMAANDKPVGVGGQLDTEKTSFVEKTVLETPAPQPNGGQEVGAAGVRTREKWSRKIDFLLACIGFSVGLGNVWRFPYLCYKNGGGAFLVPYFICVALAGIPLFFLEVSLGQFMSVGGVGVWNICPLLQGIGFATAIIVFLLNVYYNVILAWAFYYLFSSFTSKLPWDSCDNPWNTAACRHALSGADNDTSLGANWTDSVVNGTANHTDHFTDPATEYWELKVLKISSGLEDLGTVKWDVALCLVLAWIVVYLCIWKGIKSSGKVMYFTATSPYILMFVLLIRGATLPGALEGIKFYIIPEWDKLKDPQVWVDAGTQIFFSYSISIGTLTALGSYNTFNHNCWRDSILFACANSGTSFFAGFVIFSVLGFMAHEHGVPVSEVAESGPGLAFIAYPKAVSQMPIAPLWSILFFFMIILLGLDSQFVGVEGFVTAVVDFFPNYLRRGHRQEIFVAVVCFVSMLVGLPMTTYGGMYVFQLFDYYSGSRIVVLVSFFECVAVAWIYGVNRFYDNIRMMLGFKLRPYMKICWFAVTPIFSLAIFGLCIYSYSELTYNRTYHYPGWGILIGWMLACSSVVMIPLVLIVKVAMETGSFLQRIRKLIRPRLEPHQMRPCDSPKDLITNRGTENLDVCYTQNGDYITVKPQPATAALSS